MVHAAAAVGWTVVDTEVEALQLEYTWIKQYDPRFNVRYRDDKSYPWLAVTVSDEVPRVQVMRGPKRKGVRYFGPLLPRLGHPGDPRPAAARLPGAHLQQRRLPPGGPGRAALPARLHRQVLRPLRRAHRRRGPPRAGGRLLRLPRRADRPVHQGAGAGDGAGRRRPGVRARGPHPRRPRRAAAGGGEADRGARRRDGRRRRRRGARRARGGGPGVPRARRPGAGPARLRARPGGGHHHGAPGRRLPAGALPRRRLRRAQGGARPRGAGGGRGAAGAAGAGARGPGRPPRAAAGGQEGAAGHGDEERRAELPAAQAAPRRGPHVAQPCPGGAAGVAGSARGAAAGGVLRHLQPAGHRRRGVHGRVRGRPGPHVGVPAASPCGAWGRRRRTRPGRPTTSRPCTRS